VALARGLGAQAFRVERASEVGDYVREALSCGGPCLLELQVSAPPVG
jgi:thiamine pyrophosphate-dependent acetolactate synthase large subunit-like protein